MKKGWYAVFGASIVGGIIGGSMFKRKKKDTAIDSLKDKFIGSWKFSSTKQKNQHLLTIDENLVLAIDESVIHGSVIELSEYRLVIRDQFGYQITVCADDEQPVSILDETDDEIYSLVEA
jgi:ribosomal protein S25